MKSITKEHVIAMTVLVVVLGTIGGVYQFYYKSVLEEYSANVQTLDRYKAKFQHFEDTFNGVKPEALISYYRAKVQPLNESIERRALYFNVADFREIDPIPEDRMLKFYYEEQFRAMREAFRNEVLSRNPYFSYPDVTFGAPRPEDFAGQSVTRPQVRNGLVSLRFGYSMLEMLLKAKAMSVNDIQVWPARIEYGGLLRMFTTGFSMYIMAEDLVEFLDDLRTQDRYFTVNGISIQNPYLKYPSEPPLEVRMLVTQAVFVPPNTRGGGRGVSGGGGGGSSVARGGGSAEERLRRTEELLANRGFVRNDDDDRRRRQPLTRWGKIKRWLRRYFWPF